MPAPRLVILLDATATEAALAIALRYALTAAAMEVAVEVHAVGSSVELFSRRAATPTLTQALREAVATGIELYACPVALAQRGLAPEDLAPEVGGIRGAASLVVAGLQPGARFMVF